MNFVKSVYNSLTTNYRPNIDFIKICHMKFNSNFIGLTILLCNEGIINIYLFQLNPLSFNLISCFKAYREKLVTIEPINHIQLFEKDFPVIAVISNSEEYNKNIISFYSIMNGQKQLKTLYKKYPIISVVFSTIYFGVACIHGKIYIHSNTNLDLIFKITADSIIKKGEIKDAFGPNQTSIILQKNNNKLPKEDKKEDDNFHDFTELNLKQSENAKKYHDNYNILFDLNNNILVYQIIKEKSAKKEDINMQEINPQESIFESIIKSTKKNLNKFTEWSFNSFQNINQLRKSMNISYDNIQKSTSSKLYLSLFNLNSSPISNKYISNQLLLPYFNEKIGFIKIDDLYLIVGNRENQMFYIFQYFAPTNNKYSKNNKIEKNTYKLIYSIWRGYQGGSLSCLKISRDKRYCILTSKKGSNHIYYLPKRENQIVEILNYPSYSNKEDIGFENWNEILNDNIINVEEINKINHNNYNDKEKSLFYSELIELEQFHLDNNVSDELKNQIKNLNKNNYLNSIINGRFFMILNDNFVYFYMIFNNEIMIKMKKIQLKLNEDPGVIELNKININKDVYYNFNKNKEEKNIEDTFDNESTNLSFFSTPQLNPLFSFHILNNWNNNIETNETAFYENICNDLEYSNLDKKESKKRNKNNKSDSEDMIEKNIKDTMSKRIEEFINN